MKKYGDNLFQIGEAAKILGVTRKAILVYEEMGLLTPAVKDKDSGFRYYSADNLAQIRSIRSLQTLGLSLRNITTIRKIWMLIYSVSWNCGRAWTGISRPFRPAPSGRAT